MPHFPDPDGPLASRTTLFDMMDEEGYVTELAEEVWGITASNGQTFYAVNLPDELKTEGLHVHFDAAAKEIFMEEMWAAQPVILTAIEVIGD